METTHKEQKMNATLAARMTVSAQIQAIAQRRIAALPSEDAMFARRDELKANLERGVSAVALAELHILEEEIAAYEGAGIRAGFRDRCRERLAARGRVRPAHGRSEGVVAVASIEFTPEELDAILSALEGMELEYGLSVGPGVPVEIPGDPYGARRIVDTEYDAGQALLAKVRKAVAA